jgi:hypothetical protein
MNRNVLRGVFDSFDDRDDIGNYAKMEEKEEKVRV